LISHFRFSTSGFSENNNQPITTKDYIVIHNGIFSFYKLPFGLSDTAFFAKILQKRSKNLGKKDINEEKELIKKLLKSVNGSFSIFIYSKKTKKLYYIKNYLTSFSFCYNGLLGSTNSSRFPVLTQKVKADKLMEI